MKMREGGGGVVCFYLSLPLYPFELKRNRATPVLYVYSYIEFAN